ncbi:DMT family transporter [[Pasteurella] aerogenes]
MNKQGYGYFCLILATLFWGGNYIFGKILSQDLHPIILNYSRWFPAAVVMLLLFYKRLPPYRAEIYKSWKIITALAILGIIIFPVFTYQGLTSTSALNSSIYLAVVPIVVIFINRLVFGDPIRSTALIGAIVSFLGVLWLLSRGELSNLLALDINRGDLWAMGAALAWALYCCIIRLRPALLPNSVFLTCLITSAMLLFTPIFLYVYLQTDIPIYSAFTTEQWEIIAYLIIGPSILSYAFWNYGISVVGGEKGAVFTNTTPLFAAALSILILGESLYIYHIISAILIVFGLLLCNRK